MFYRELCLYLFFLIVANSNLIESAHRSVDSRKRDAVAHNLDMQNPDQYYVTLESHQLHEYRKCAEAVHTLSGEDPSFCAIKPVSAKQSTRQNCCSCPKELFVVDGVAESLPAQQSTFWLTVERLGSKDVCLYTGNLTLIGPNPQVRIAGYKEGSFRIDVRDCSLEKIGT